MAAAQPTSSAPDAAGAVAGAAPPTRAAAAATTVTAAAASSPRVSLACIPCRDRHVRCGAERPKCERCSTAGKNCYYTKSRRGGLDRATLAARRSRRAEAEAAAAKAAGLEAGGGLEGKTLGAGSEIDPLSGRNSSGNPSSPDQQHQCHHQQQQPQPCLFSSPGNQSPLGCLDPSLCSYPDLGRIRSTSSDSPTPDAFFDFYYFRFHHLHPFVLPRPRFEQLLQDSSRAAEMKPLVSAMRYAGSFFARPQPGPQARQQLLEAVHAAMAEAEGHFSRSRSPFLVQCRLLLSIVVYWSGGPSEARALLDSAVALALDLGMNRAEFAAAYGASDRVLGESWIRTWWQLLIVDACAAATNRVFVFWVCTLETTVVLPCEEAEYESGNIPPAKTLEDMESRELELDSHVYSSFAYLVDAFRSVSNALSATPSLTDPHGSSQVIHEIDAIFDAWFLLLPDSKKDALTKHGEVDALMFQAHMVINTAILSIHRPFSRILFSPLESISSCVVFPTDERINKESLIIHTTRCLRAIEAQVRLLTLPSTATSTRRFCQSPFIVCMVVTGAIPLLAAHRTIFTGGRVAVARNQFRLVIGCLMALADVWPRAGGYLKELQELARLTLRGPEPQGSSPRGAVGGAPVAAAVAAPSVAGGGVGGGSRQCDIMAAALTAAAATAASPTCPSSSHGMVPPSSCAATPPEPPPRSDPGEHDWLVSEVAAAINSFPVFDTAVWGGGADMQCDLQLW